MGHLQREGRVSLESHSVATQLQQAKRPATVLRIYPSPGHFFPDRDFLAAELSAQVINRAGASLPRR